ncbi:RAI1 like PD-XK nuclease-domain-containing protein [Apodospora peruviana]|uniref:Decapping nuclease n=1 Tax=Apodospora peruviana TaxID=516989 RepID=A0AAE0MBY6_9PEZI|nr:RAI1 like PD-XK nuclease-domain-containing protein [Apodospora peruviana]
MPGPKPARVLPTRFPAKRPYPSGYKYNSLRDLVNRGTTAHPIKERRDSPMTAALFPVHPDRFRGESDPVKRPKEFACFSYDQEHRFRLDDSSLKWYYPPTLGADLSKGFEDFIKHDDSIDEHLDSLLATIAHHEKETGKPIDAHVVTWRGMMAKIMAVPFEPRDGFEMNATLYRGTIFIEENHGFKRGQEELKQFYKNPIPMEVMSFWGYKFETLSTLPAPWGETSREYIESRDTQVVNNKEQYCSVVRTGLGKSILCLGGEVDAIWDSKPDPPGATTNWVELKTTAELIKETDMDNFENKVMKWWIQSFLLGVPKIIAGFRSRDGILVSTQEIATIDIPNMVKQRNRARWDGNVCINFASAFLEWLRQIITDEGVWRVRYSRRAAHIEVFRIEEVGHGSIITEEFMNWRIKLDRAVAAATEAVVASEEVEQEPVETEQQVTTTTTTTLPDAAAAATSAA